MFVIFLLDKSPKAPKNLPRLASWCFIYRCSGMQQKYICENKLRMRLFLGPTLFMCECKGAVGSVCFSLHSFFFFFFCQVKPLGSTNLLCYSVGVSHRRGHPFTFNPPPITAFCSPGVRFRSAPALSSSHPFSLSSSKSPPSSRKCQKCSVRRIRYVPYESVFLLLSN